MCLPMQEVQESQVPTLKLRRSFGGGHGNPLQYSCLENSMGQGDWQATVHAATKSRTWLSNWTHIYVCSHACVRHHLLFSSMSPVSISTSGHITCSVKIYWVSECMLKRCAPFYQEVSALEYCYCYFSSHMHSFTFSGKDRSLPRQKSYQKNKKRLWAAAKPPAYQANSLPLRHQGNPVDIS